MNDSNGSLTSYYDECPDPSLCTLPNFEDNVPLAFGLTIAAGFATVLGAIPPLLPCIKHTNRKLLAGSLSVAAGVMLYVSFTEILLKATNNFCCVTNKHFTLVAIGCFFGGILLTVVLDLLVHLLERFDQSVLKRKCLARVSHAFCTVCCYHRYKGKEKQSSRKGSVNKTTQLPVSSDSDRKHCPGVVKDGMCGEDFPSLGSNEVGTENTVEVSVHSSNVPHLSEVGLSGTDSERVSSLGSHSPTLKGRASSLDIVANVSINLCVLHYSLCTSCIRKCELCCHWIVVWLALSAFIANHSLDGVCEVNKVEV